jgi:flagellar hook-basal body complex protein FliE
MAVEATSLMALAARAASAYGQNTVGDAVSAANPAVNAPAANQSADFSASLSQALDGALSLGKTADTQAAQAITGTANLTDVVTAVSRAELALQTTVAIRDRVLQAYQDIVKMPI